MKSTILLWVSALATNVIAQKACANAIAPAKAPTVAKGYSARVLVNGINSPRDMVVDSEGNLLVVSTGTGIMGIKLTGDDNCVSAATPKRIVSQSSLNHGIALSPDGKTLYASSRASVFKWAYDAKTMAISGQSTTVVTGMTSGGHSTRTLLIPKSAPNLLLISRGSDGNIDAPTVKEESGRSQIRIFDLAQPKAYTYLDGKILAWGLRNSVGLAENPVDGGIWSNENGSDNLQRDGQDIHENMPGEEINFHGIINATANPYMGKNYGYPSCASVWQLQGMPRNNGLKVGSQFSLAAANAAGSVTDAACNADFQGPRLTLPSHWAPIDIAFNSKGTVAYMTSRGSWNKRSPDGYRLFAIKFDPATGQPVEPATSTTAAIPILTNANQAACPAGCFRPTGVTFDNKGRLFMASETTKEIFIIGTADGGVADTATL